MKPFKFGPVLILSWIAACSSQSPRTPPATPDSSGNKLDLLFMIDNSASMAPLQNKLLQQFPAFMNVLKQVPTPDGSGVALPDIHVAVVSSDTGPGEFDLPDVGCRLGGDRGQFQYQPRGACLTSPFRSSATPQTFLSASQNQTVTNFDGDISDAFACIAALGDHGCGFEGQLKSVRLALDPSNVPTGNQGFLRPDARLAVVLVTNEDDCSVPDDSDLFDPKQTLMSDPYGPFWSFRCNEFGHLCNIDGTLQPPPRGPAQHLQGCVSNETPTGKLTKVADEVAFLKGLKSDPSQVVVAAITGIPSDYSIDMIQNAGDVEPHPSIEHSCVTSAGEYADPAVRLMQWVSAFGTFGAAETICADSFAPSLVDVATQIVASMGALPSN